jgi:spore coat protein U-like protein
MMYLLHQHLATKVTEGLGTHPHPLSGIDIMRNTLPLSYINRAVRAALVAGLGFVAVGAWADVDTANLTVNATVANQCSVGDATLSLGAITLVSPDGTMAVSGGGTTGIPWACTNGTSATLGFDNGSNYSSTRRMVSASAGSSNQYLEYTLKTGSSGGTTIASTALDLSGADGTNQTFTVWGGPVSSAANKAAKPATDYTDTVVMTITFTP